MLKKDRRFNVNHEMISGAILSRNDSNDHANFVFLHGGAGNKERIYSVIPPVLDSGINVLTFDFSGHGESTGQLKKSSLKKRVEEAKTAIKNFTPQDGSVVICGASMGGYIAIKMLEFFQVKSLVLFCPALYDKNAYDISFDEGFTEIIRAPDSWRNTDALHLLENFTGNILVIMGDKDEVIPSGVIDLIMQHTPRAAKKELYIIPNCPHKIFDRVAPDANELNKLQQKIIEYL